MSSRRSKSPQFRLLLTEASRHLVDQISGPRPGRNPTRPKTRRAASTCRGTLLPNHGMASSLAQDRDAVAGPEILHEERGTQQSRCPRRLRLPHDPAVIEIRRHQLERAAQAKPGDDADDRHINGVIARRLQRLMPIMT